MCFAIKAVKAVVAAVGAERAAIHLSPWATFQSATSSESQTQLLQILREFKQLKLSLGIISLIETTDDPIIWLPAKKEELDQHRTYRRNSRILDR